MLSLEEFIKGIREKKIIERYHLQKFGIFGSFARGERANDIDVLVETDQPYALLELQEELEKMSGGKVDVVREKYANPIILYRAKHDLIYVG